MNKILIVFILLISQTINADLIIYHIDVNMGDAIFFVDTKSKMSLLVDCGNRSYGKNVVAPFLKKLGYDSINYFVATHYDSDHIGGFDEMIEGGINFEVVYDRGDYTDRKVVTATGRNTQYGEYIYKAGNKRKKLNPGCLNDTNPEQNSIYLGSETTVEVVAVGGVYIKNDCTKDSIKIKKKYDNALSIALVLRNDNFSYFIGGDLTGGGNGKKDVEFLIAPAVGDVDVLKLNHHGSATSSNNAFLQTLKPEVTIISVGDGGVNRRYGLPKQDVLDRVTGLFTNPAIFLTHKGEGGESENSIVEDGHIIIITNGNSYSVNNKVYLVDERI